VPRLEIADVERGVLESKLNLCLNMNFAVCIRRLLVVGSTMSLALQAHAAPDELTLGKLFGYPRGNPETVFNHLVGSFSALDEVFPSRKVAREGSV